jgi:cobalt-zinc-cadmium efflux system protein
MKESNSNDSTGNILIAFLLNLCFAIIELIGGVVTNSVAILSDAIHDFGDSLSLGVAYYLQRKSKKRGDDKFTYGYRRFSLLGSVFISVVLLFGSMIMVSESIERLINPQESNAFGMIALSLLGIVVNGAAVIKLRRGKSHNEKAVTLHMMEDVLGWGAILIGSIIMYFTGISYIDPLLSLIVVIWVIINVYRNLKETFSILLQQVPPELDISKLEQKLANVDGVKSISDFHVWSMDGEKNIASLHYVCKPDFDSITVKGNIRSVLLREGIEHSTIEQENQDESDRNKGRRECR